jgi:hypothetical protein
VALEEPQENDSRLDVEGVPLAVPPDVARVLRVYDDAVLDHDPRPHRPSHFFVRFGRRSRECS